MCVYVRVDLDFDLDLSISLSIYRSVSIYRPSIFSPPLADRMYGSHIANLNVGDSLGEMSLTIAHQHNATVVAMQETILLVLDKDHFREFLAMAEERQQDVEFHPVRCRDVLLTEPGSESQAFHMFLFLSRSMPCLTPHPTPPHSTPPHPTPPHSTPFPARTEDDIKLIRSFVSKIKFFQQIGDEMQEALVRQAKYHHAKPGEVVVKQGDRGFSFFAILSGIVDVHIKEEQAGDGESDGEGAGGSDDQAGENAKKDGSDDKGQGEGDGEVDQRDGASDGGHDDADKASVEGDDDENEESSGAAQALCDATATFPRRRLSADQQRIEQQYALIKQQSRKKTFRQWSKNSVLSTRVLSVPFYDDVDGVEGDGSGGGVVGEGGGVGGGSTTGTGGAAAAAGGGGGGGGGANGGDREESTKNSVGSVEDEDDGEESFEVLYGNRVCTLSAGDSFGEQALTNDEATRNATIVAPDGADFIVFEKEAYLSILQTQGRKILFNVNTCRDALTKVPRARTKEDVSHLLRLAGTILFFQQVPARQRRKLCKVMKLLIYDANEGEL